MDFNPLQFEPAATHLHRLHSPYWDVLAESDHYLVTRHEVTGEVLVFVNETRDILPGDARWTRVTENDSQRRLHGALMFLARALSEERASQKVEEAVA